MAWGIGSLVTHTPRRPTGHGNPKVTYAFFNGNIVGCSGTRGADSSDTSAFATIRLCRHPTDGKPVVPINYAWARPKSAGPVLEVYR